MGIVSAVVEKVAEAAEAAKAVPSKPRKYPRSRIRAEVTAGNRIAAQTRLGSYTPQRATAETRERLATIDSTTYDGCIRGMGVLVQLVCAGEIHPECASRAAGTLARTASLHQRREVFPRGRIPPGALVDLVPGTADPDPEATGVRPSTYEEQLRAAKARPGGEDA